MIVYRDDIKEAHSPRWPSWLEGAANLCRRESEHGDMIAVTDPMIFPDGNGLPWKRIGDSWSAAVVGSVALQPLIRHRSDCSTLGVVDAKDRVWMVPAVLDPHGNVALSVSISNVDGVWKRAPSPEQAAIIEAAKSARLEIESGKLSAVPIDAACSWCSMFLAYTYYINAETLGACALMDDKLIIATLLSAAGYPPPLS